MALWLKWNNEWQKLGRDEPLASVWHPMDAVIVLLTMDGDTL
ncbi:hypothetical protein [Photobacterium kasasachensis]